MRIFRTNKKVFYVCVRLLGSGARRVLVDALPFQLPIGYVPTPEILTSMTDASPIYLFVGLRRKMPMQYLCKSPAPARHGEFRLAPRSEDYRTPSRNAEYNPKVVSK